MHSFAKGEHFVIAAQLQAFSVYHSLTGFLYGAIWGRAQSLQDAWSRRRRDWKTGKSRRITVRQMAYLINAKTLALAAVLLLLASGQISHGLLRPVRLFK